MNSDERIMTGAWQTHYENYEPTTDTLAAAAADDDEAGEKAPDRKCRDSWQELAQ